MRQLRHLEEEANKMHAQRMIQEVDGKYVVVNPPFPLMTTAELDAAFCAGVPSPGGSAAPGPTMCLKLRRNATNI